jgi:hypothetical protein
MLPLLLLAAAALAGPYQALRDQAEAEQRLVPGDTAVLVGLAGELGCVAAHDPEDCEAMRVRPPDSVQPLLELVPVPVVVLPALGDEPPSLLLPRFPYGLGEPVTPVLGPMGIEGSLDAWVRLALPEGIEIESGHGEATLLMTPDPTGPTVQPFVEPPGPPPMLQLVGDLQAEVWPQRLAAFTRVQVLLPLRPVAIRLLHDGAAPLEIAWPEASPALAGQPLVEPGWTSRAVERLTTASGLCMRAYYASSLRRPSREPPVLPAHMTAPRLALITDEHGQVLDAVALDLPWSRPEPSACLRANARMLPPAPEGASLAVLPLSLAPIAPAAP